MTQQKIKSSKQIFNKSENTERDFFVKMPSNLMNYVHVPGYKPEYSYLYTIIVDYFNADIGYAYPTEWQISRKYGKGVKTVRGHLRKLEDFGLIKIAKPQANKIYVPYKPLSQEELFKDCPEAETKYKANIAAEAAEKKRQEKQTAEELGVI